MISKPILNYIVIIGFMILVGFSLAKAIYSQSITGILLSVVSMGAGIYFLHLLGRAREEKEYEETA